MRIALIILLLWSGNAYGQAKTTFAGGRATDTAYTPAILKANSYFYLPLYATANPNQVLGFTATGQAILRTMTGGNADSVTFFTNYRADTMRKNIYAAIGNAAPDSSIYQTVYGNDTGNTGVESRSVSNAGTPTSIDAAGAAHGDLLSYDLTSNTWLPFTPDYLGRGLTDGYIYIGDGANTARAQLMSGDGTIDNAGVLAIDSIKFATRLRVQKGLDSIAAIKQNTISLTTTGTSGAASFNPTTGALNVPQYSGQTYTAGGWMGLSSNAFYFDTANHRATNFSILNNFLLPTTAAVNTQINTALSGYVPTSRTISATAPLTGGGVLSSNLTLSMPAGTSLADGYLTALNWSTFNSKQDPATTLAGYGITDAYTKTAADARYAPIAINGTVTTLSIAATNGFAGSVANPTTTPVVTMSVTATGVLKGGSGAVSAATAGTDYSAGTSALATGILKSTTGTGGLTIAVAADFPTLNQNTTGSAATLTTPRNINGASFNGSADITVTAAAGTLTGTTLNSTVTGTSITSTGAITSGTWSTGAVIAGATMTLGSDAANDIYYRSSGGVLTRLAAGTDGKVLTTHSTSSAPTWETAAGGSSTIVYAGTGISVTGTASVNPTVSIAAATVYTMTETSKTFTCTATNSSLQYGVMTNTNVTDTLVFAGFTNTAAGGCGKINQVTIMISQDATGGCGLYLKGTNFLIAANTGRIPPVSTVASTGGNNIAIILYCWYDPQTSAVIVDYGYDYRKP